MTPKRIVVTDRDLADLLALLKDVRRNRAEQERYLRDLESELRRAVVVSTCDVPPDVVTMNSRVTVRGPKERRSQTYTLVYPAEASVEDMRVSVLAPLGTALLGYRVGDRIEWRVPAGTTRFEIVAIPYQPQANGMPSFDAAGAGPGAGQVACA